MSASETHENHVERVGKSLTRPQRPAASCHQPQTPVDQSGQVVQGWPASRPGLGCQSWGSPGPGPLAHPRSGLLAPPRGLPVSHSSFFGTPQSYLQPVWRSWAAAQHVAASCNCPLEQHSRLSELLKIFLMMGKARGRGTAYLCTVSLLTAPLCAGPCRPQEWHIISAKAVVPVCHLLIAFCSPNDRAVLAPRTYAHT